MSRRKIPTPPAAFLAAPDYDAILAGMVGGGSWNTNKSSPAAYRELRRTANPTRRFGPGFGHNQII
jgi:hypothetical protein